MSSNNNKADEVEEPILAEEREMPSEEEFKDAPKPFNFGPMGELAGMKITQAASFETRVLRLEMRIQDLEGVVSQIHSTSSTDALLLQEPPRRSSLRNRSTSANRPRPEESDVSVPQPQQYRGVDQPPSQRKGARTGSQVRSSSYGSSRPSTTSTSNSYQPPFSNISSPFPPPSEEADFSSSPTTARPLSTSTTIRGAPSTSPTISKDGVLTAEHYTTLTNMILAEQAARQDLEAIVRSLQQQLQKLRRASHLPGGTKDNTDRGDFSSFGQGDSSDDESRYAHEEFRTPNEERTQFGDEIFGGRGGSEGEVEVKSAARTMSLSQMTLGRGMQPSLNF
jgi:hypothetical protein